MQPQASDPTEPGQGRDSGSSSLGVVRFLHNNETLIKMESLVFAALGLLRAQPEGDAVAILQCLSMVIGLIIFVRLWEGLPRRYGVLPGIGWTFELTLMYYCLTFTLVVGLVYMMGGLVDQRNKYLWVALGTLLAVGGATTISHRTTVAPSLSSASARYLGADRRSNIVSFLIATSLLVTIVGAYALAHLVSPEINRALDEILAAPR